MSGLRFLHDSKGELVDSFYLILLQGVNQFLPVLLIPYLMYTLGAAGYGYVGFALSVVQVVTLVVDFGFDLSATKHIAQVRDDRPLRDEVFWNVLAAKCLLLCVSGALLGIAVAFVPVFSVYGWAIWATFPMAVGSVFSCMWFFQGIGKVRVYSVLNTLSKVLLLPLVFICVKSPADYVWAALLQSSVFVSTAVISCFYIWRKGWVSWHWPRRVDLFAEIKDSFPLFLSKASTSVYTQLFVVVLGFFCTTEAIGRYTSAERIMRAVCFFLVVPINQAFFPKVSHVSEKNKAEAIGIFKSVLALMAVCMFFVFLLLFIGGSFLPQLLGPDYDGIDSLLHVLAWAPIGIGLGAVYGQIGLVAMGGGKARNCFRNVYFMVALFAMVAVAVTAPLWGTLGAAWSLVISEWLVLVLMFHYFHRVVVCC